MINFIKRLFCRHYKVEQGEPVAPPPMFAVAVAAGKWDSLQLDGYRMQHIVFTKGEKVGSIDAWGKVMWLPSKAEESQPVRPMSDEQIDATFEKVASLHSIPVSGGSVVLSAIVGVDQAKEFARAIEAHIKGATE